MALIVEDGTGKEDAESYLSVAAADTYFTGRGAPAAWTALDTAKKEAALRYASQALDGMFEWRGVMQTTSQALSWPRSGAYDFEGGRSYPTGAVPERVMQATCELALLHLTSPLNTSYDRGGAVRKEKVGPIETEYEAGAPVEAWVPQIDRVLLGLGQPRSGCQVTLERG